MDKLRKYTSRVFKPPLLFILITDSTAFPLVGYVLTALDEVHPVSIAAYTLSAYALTITVINFIRLRHC